MRLCSFEGCGRMHDCHGLCKTHNKQLVSGKALSPIKYKAKHPDDRFVQYVDKAGECWLWSSELNSQGYGRFSLGNKRVFAHRHAYEMWVAPIPVGSSVAHSCHVKSCCNPAHLFIVSGKGGKAITSVRIMLEARIQELEEENKTLRSMLSVPQQQERSI